MSLPGLKVPKIWALGPAANCTINEAAVPR